VVSKFFCPSTCVCDDNRKKPVGYYEFCPFSVKYECPTFQPSIILEVDTWTTFIGFDLTNKDQMGYKLLLQHSSSLLMWELKTFTILNDVLKLLQSLLSQGRNPYPSGVLFSLQLTKGTNKQAYLSARTSHPNLRLANKA
jgi:hypothetical protein